MFWGTDFVLGSFDLYMLNSFSLKPRITYANALRKVEPLLAPSPMILGVDNVHTRKSGPRCHWSRLSVPCVPMVCLLFPYFFSVRSGCGLTFFVKMWPFLFVIRKTCIRFLIEERNHRHIWHPDCCKRSCQRCRMSTIRIDSVTFPVKLVAFLKDSRSYFSVWPVITKGSVPKLDG